MLFVQAFIVGGLLCAFFQLLTIVTRLDYSLILILSIAAGAILLPFGITSFLEQAGSAGMYATFMDAGAAFTGTLISAFLGGGWISFLIIFCIVVLQIPLGICAGIVYTKKHEAEFETEPVQQVAGQPDVSFDNEC